MKHTYFLPLILAAVCALAQQSSGPSYSFTISGSQVWTDTGVDLAAGDELNLSAEAKPGSEAGCSASGANTSSSSEALPVPSSSSGALIAKTSEKAVPVMVGSKNILKADVAGHLFLGVNQTAPSNCAYAVKVQIGHTPGSSSADAAATSSPAATEKPAAQSTTNAAAHPNLKSQLSSAAQVFLKGQFGASGSPSAAQSSNVVSASAAAAPASAASTGSTLPSVTLDADLRQHIDGLPRRVHDHAGNLGDMVNFVIIGSQDRVQTALNAADWHLADLDSKESGLKAILDTYQKKEYLEMPMSHLYLFDRMQDFGYEQAQAFAVVATRHHFRIWKAPFTWNNEVVWVGAATHDIGFEKDVRTGKLTHKIDPDIDSERANLAQGFDKAGKADIAYYLPPNPVQEAKNASGGGYHSDGRLLVVILK